MKTVLSFSGGLDSTALLAQLLEDEHEVLPVNFSYGSKHNYQERRAARTIAGIYNKKLIEIDLEFIGQYFKSALLKNGDAIPEGHYEADCMKQTVVPFRNGIMLSILAGIAESNDCEAVAIAAHSGDHHIYPDCRLEFLEAMRGAIKLGTYKQVNLLAPFTNMTKADVVRIGSSLEAPLSLSWTCYKGFEKHCGKCGSCDERKRAFIEAGVIDPTIYQEV